ncbi:MAG: septum formation protein [Oceanicoccus sp.]|jgi:septum formation protein
MRTKLCAPRLYLASQSPRRAELLAQIGVEFQRIDASVDETSLPDEAAKDYVERVAIAKAQAGWQHVVADGQPIRPVLGADTSVILRDKSTGAEQIMGKPRNRDHAIEMLSALSGNSHQVMTALCLCNGEQQLSTVVTTKIDFRPLSAQEIADYWASGEPLGKAGAYAIQGFAAVFVKQITGSYSAVVGLPLLQTLQLLEQIEQHDSHPT